MDDLIALEDWLAPLLAKLQPNERRKLAHDMARDLRRSQAQRIAAQRNPNGSSYVPRKAQLRDRKGRVRRKMFNKIRQATHLKTQATAGEASVGFAGRVARIASVHQHGLYDRVRPEGPVTTYHRRQLLGFTDADVSQIERLLLHLVP
jgi:phage virion morphogenesis protein